MRIRFFVPFLALLMTVAAGVPAAFGFLFGPSRLEALAARHDLRDTVCIAMADGRLSAWERGEILVDAKRILYHEEYIVFKRVLDRISPPPAKSSARSQRLVRRPANTKPRRVPAPPQATPLQPPTPPAEQAEPPMSGPIIPVGATLPDRMASSPGVR